MHAFIEIELAVIAVCSILAAHDSFLSLWRKWKNLMHRREMSRQHGADKQ